MVDCIRPNLELRNETRNSPFITSGLGFSKIIL
jgi:hypothetical protein